MGWGGCLGLGLGGLLELPEIAPPGMVALEMTECLLVLGKLLFCTQGIGRGTPTLYSCDNDIIFTLK